jgi:TolB protein
MTQRRRPRFRHLLAVIAAFSTAVPPLGAQQEIAVEIDPSRAASIIRVAVPFPQLGAGVPGATVQQSFYSPLTRDLAWSDVFAIVPLPPNAAPTVEAARAAKAQVFLKLDITIQGEEYVVEARLQDVTSGSVQLAKRYRGTAPALTRIAHTIANDLVRHFRGNAGIFLTQIAFVSTRDGTKEIYMMDFDGSNQRRITAHRSISLSPKWSPDGEQIVYTSFSRGTSDLYLINRRGGGRIRLDTGVNLNTSPSFSPDGSEIAFVGSVGGNPDIYVISKNGGRPRRLTTANTIESTPAFSPTGRQIAFTSSRTGTPQIYLMDAEGTNVRRLSFDGNWNDDAAWSPGGDYLAYTSRVSGRFQIRIVNLSTMQARIIAGEGSNEQPTWSPDGRSLLFTSNRTGRWQIYRVSLDGSNMVQLTFEGENTAPNWSPAVQ